MSITSLPSQWTTQRLRMKDSTPDDVPELQKIYDACAYTEEWTGLTADEAEQPILSALLGRDLPPYGSPEFSRLQSVELNGTSQTIGYLQMYHGYPTADVFWVATIAIHPHFQGMQYGQELVCGLIREVGELRDFGRIRLGVALKNWPALRFWTQAGFDKIVGIKGDKIHSDKTFAFVILEKPLEKPG